MISKPIKEKIKQIIKKEKSVFLNDILDAKKQIIKLKQNRL